MKVVGLLLLSLCALASAGKSGKLHANNSDSQTSPDVTETPKNTTTVQPTTEQSTTVKPTTEPSTTVKPTTTVTPSTTVEPTTEPTTTTVKPSPVPKEYYWDVVEKNGTICILAKMDITLDMKYISTNQTKNVSIKVPANASSDGTCNEKEQILIIGWVSYEGINTFAISFSLHNETKEYFVSNLEAILSKDGEVFRAESKLKPNSFLGQTPLNSSYSCEYSPHVELKTHNTTVKVTFNKIHLEAFKTDSSDKYSKTFSCGPDSPDIVPIVVGIALTLLIVGVVVGYIISRRRTQQRGYLSM